MSGTVRVRGFSESLNPNNKRGWTMQKAKPKRYRAEYHAAHVQALRESGAHNRVKVTANTWTKRQANNVTGFWKP